MVDDLEIIYVVVGGGDLCVIKFVGDCDGVVVVDFENGIIEFGVVVIL